MYEKLCIRYRLIRLSARFRWIIIKMNKIIRFLCLSLVCFAFIGCDKKYPMYTELKIYDSRLSDEEVRTVWRIVSSAKTKRICVSDRPDIVFCYKTDKGEDNFLSVYLKDAYIYDGYFIDAFTDEMKDRKSTVRCLRKSSLFELQNIIAKYSKT